MFGSAIGGSGRITCNATNASTAVMLDAPYLSDIQCCDDTHRIVHWSTMCMPSLYVSAQRSSASQYQNCPSSKMAWLPVWEHKLIQRRCGMTVKQLILCTYTSILAMHKHNTLASSQLHAGEIRYCFQCGMITPNPFPYVTHTEQHT